ncbi:MAG: ATP-binding protein [Planctomycetota bacterium]|nr:MAG: ATP-binding protein [Planctomycetota bacterium]
MKAFTQIARPHDDVVDGRLTMDVFAADLWQVASGQAPAEYQDADLFFKRTYTTEGLKNILDIAKARLEGRSGDSILQLQTPFGGGKTHTLIALYHSARGLEGEEGWGAKVVVLDGTTFNPRERRLWEELERQLRGKVEMTRGDTAPGKEALVRLLSGLWGKGKRKGRCVPVLILMDEVLEYITKAAGVRVGDSNLAAQTFAFLQELTGAVSTVGHALLVLTLPSSTLEHYDANAEKMFYQLQKITGRMERIYTPVRDEEIEYVVRARLFQEVDEGGVREVVDEFVKYARREELLSREEMLEYRERFLRSYPFKPDVIDVLYKRWGSFPTFQRTRGVLRILSLVVHRLLGRGIPFIRLGDFDLRDMELRRELIKYIGQEWDSIIAQDIVDKGSGAERVNRLLGTSYEPYRLGSVVSTTIFMMSFSGRGDGGGSAVAEAALASSVRELKLSAGLVYFSSTVIDTAISSLREKLFYLSDEGLFFSNVPNLNRILILREENVTDGEIYEERREVIRRHIARESRFRVYLHPEFPKDIADNEELKLVVIEDSFPSKEFLERYGEGPRVYRNTMIFLGVEGDQEEGFVSYLRKLIALRNVERDRGLRLTEGQRKELRSKIARQNQLEYEELRRFYRKLFVPSGQGRSGEVGFQEIDMGLPTFGERELDREIFTILKNLGEVLERLSPRVIRDRYLGDCVEVRVLYESLLKAPGELRVASWEGFLEGIREGVEAGLFRVGEFSEDGKGVFGGRRVRWKGVSELSGGEGEVILRLDMCEGVEEELEEKGDQSVEGVEGGGGLEGMELEEKGERRVEEVRRVRRDLELVLGVEVGQMSTVSRVVRYLKERFRRCEAEYEDKVLEALYQEGIRVERG